MVFILVTVMLDTLGFGLLIPVAPLLVQNLAGTTEPAAAPYVGALAATYAALQLLFAPALGALSDRFGRRPVLLVALCGSGLDYFAMALAPSLWVLFLTRAINGMSGASFSVCNAYVADVTPPEKRAGAFGMVGAAFGVGFVLGPLIGGVLGNIDIHLPFYAAGALTLINWLYGLFVLPESLAPGHRAHFRLARANPFSVFGSLRRHPLVAALAGGFFLVYLAQFGLYATWTLYTAFRYGWSPRQVGLSLFIVGVCAMVVQGGLARQIIPVLGEKRSLLLGLFMAILAYLGYGLATEGWMIYVVIIATAAGGIAQPAAQSIITRAVTREEQGATQGALAGLQGVATILGSLIGTAAFDYAATHFPRTLPGLNFLISASFAAMGWIVSALALRVGGGPTPVTVQAGDAPGS